MRVKKAKTLVNIYGDESCHLENDCQQAMVLGAVICEATKVKKFTKELRLIKKKHGLKTNFELKWSKVSIKKLEFYQEVLAYFFENPDLQFRALIIPDKNKLNHQTFEQTHDQWYYKMYFQTLKILFSREQNYHIYLDIKDTQGGEKLRQLKEILCQGSKTTSIKKIQLIRSNEVFLIQITDLLIGALGYQARGLSGSQAKQQLINFIRGQIGFPLNLSSPKKEKKFNCLVWEAH